MTHTLANLMAESIVAGLQRKTLTSCSRWAQACRIMGKPFAGKFSFKYHPWLREMHDSTAELNVGQKGAQLGYTEWALNVAFFNIDVKRVDTLYVLPAQTPDASDFSAARFDPALELSPHLTKLFSDVQNVGHKRAGTTNLYVRGSKSRSGLKSIPVGLIILDEVDEMEEENIPLALERAAGQVEKMVLAISTPTLPRHGINKLFLDTSQEHFFFKCPHCGKHIELNFPENILITADEVNDPRIEGTRLMCNECKGILEQSEKWMWLSKGIWVPQFGGRPARGFHVNQLYSSTVTPAEIAKAYLKSERDPTEEQEFNNSKMGRPHVVKGASVTDDDLSACIGGYRTQDERGSYGFITMGIDVGRWLHWEVDEWYVPQVQQVTTTDLNVQCFCKVLKFGKVHNFEELDFIMHQYRVNACVIDANPERRKAHEFSCRFPNHVKMCFYGRGIQGKQIHVASDDQPEPTITVDRTSWLDLSLGRFKARGKMLKTPIDIDQEYKTHMKALVRRYSKDKNGNPVGEYVKADNDEDHYAHARNYAEIALPFAISFASNQDITDQIL
jgi:Phage terminase large subunit (GpA)